MPYQQPNWTQNFGRYPDTSRWNEDIERYNKAIAHFSSLPDPSGVNKKMIDEYTKRRNALMGQTQGVTQSALNLRVGDLRTQAEKLADPTMLNRYFDTAGGNLSQRQGQSVGRAQATAAALAASRGLLNPSGFVANAGSQMAAPYSEAFGQLEGQRAGALIDQQKQYYNILAGLNALLTGQENTERELAIRQQLADLQAGNQYYQMNKDNATDAEVASKAALAFAKLFLGLPSVPTTTQPQVSQQTARQAQEDWWNSQLGYSPFGI